MSALSVPCAPSMPAEALAGLKVPHAMLGQRTPRERQLHVVALIAARHGLTAADLLGRDRRDHVARARWHAWYQLRRQFGSSLNQIGRLFRRDHTTILYGLRRFRETGYAR